MSDITVTNNGATVDNNGKIGKCYSFGTSTSYLTLSNNTINKCTTECSLSFWLNITSWNSSYATFFQAGLGDTPWSNYIFGILRDGTSSNLCFTISNGSSASNNSYKTSNLELNTWYHLTFVYKTGHCLIYVNGELYQDYATTIVPNFSGITKTTVGACNNGASYQTNCKINDLRVYNRALSPKEIEVLSRGLVCHYPLSLSGENLLANSIPVATGGWSASGTDWSRTLVNAEGSYNGKAMRGTYGGTAGSVRGGIYKTFSPGTGYFAEGDTYTITARLRASLNCTIRFYSNFSAAATQNITTEWATYTYTATVTNPTANGRTYIVIEPSYVTTGVWIECCMVKMEKGGKSTPWIPYISDDAYTALGFNDNIEYDVSGYGYNATKTDITYDSNTPRYNVSSVFNGTTSIIDAGNAFHVQGAKNMSMACWAYCNDWTSTESKYLISSQQSGGLLLAYLSGTTMRARWRIYTAADLSTNAYNQADFVVSLTSGWHHFCGTLDGSSIKLYIDGVCVQNTSITNYGVYFNNTASMFIGAESAGDHGTDFFNGKISDVRIYYTTLTDAQVADLYNSTASIANNGSLLGYELVEV